MTNWILSIILSLAFFLTPALWNGFALVFFDTGGYVERVLEMNLAPGRSLFYGLFLWAASWGWWSFWGPVLLQSLATVWLIHLILRFHNLPAGPWMTALMSTGLGLLTGVSWYTSQLMPDIMIPLVTLSLWLLGCHWRKMTLPERGGLGIISLLGLMSHMSCMALAMGLMGVFILLRIIFCWRQCSLPLFIFPPVTVVLASLVLMPLLHLLLAGTAGYTPGGPAFVFGSLVQNGIAQRWLADHCPATGIQLCGLQDRIPKTADDFLWADNSPFQNIGGWSGAADAELGYLVKESIKTYPGMFAWASLRATAEQLVRLETGDGLDEYHAAARGVFTQLLPRTSVSFNRAHQQQNQITQSLFDTLNRIHVPVGYLSMLGLFAVMVWGVRRQRYDFSALAFFILLALLGNAFICGALSNPHDRYQNRLIWIATLVTGMAMVGQWQSWKSSVRK